MTIFLNCTDFLFLFLRPSLLCVSYCSVYSVQQVNVVRPVIKLRLLFFTISFYRILWPAYEKKKKRRDHFRAFFYVFTFIFRRFLHVYTSFLYISFDRLSVFSVAQTEGGHVEVA